MIIIVVLSGEILALVLVKDLRNYKTKRNLDEPRWQANKPIKNVNVQYSEQVSTRIYIREICPYQFHPQT